MMHPSLQSWQKACEIMRLESSRLPCYLQWYPFSKLTERGWETLASEQFFEDYISDGAFVVCTLMRFRTRGYIQKQGVSFRNSALVSPVMFMYLLAFGIEFEKVFVDPRGRGVFKYAGDLAAGQAHYKDSYRVFCDEIRLAKSRYAYCLKTDISGFFDSISVDRLMAKMQDCSQGQFSATDALFMRSLLLFCGAGRFPTIQNHPTTSFLATMVFLSDVDEALLKRGSLLSAVGRFGLVRYVDDLYIFFDPADGFSPYSAKSCLLNLYADILRESGLTLNQKKVGYSRSDDLPLADAMESCVDFTGCYFGGAVDEVELRIAKLFSEISDSIAGGDYVQQDFENALERAFRSEDGRTRSSALFRQCLYGDENAFRTKGVILAIGAALDFGSVVLSFNTAELVRCVMRTRDERLIKRILNALFVSDRRGSWSSVDTLIAISYLLERGMRHPDLLALLKGKEPGLHLFITRYCQSEGFIMAPVTETEEKLVLVLDGDIQSKIIFINHLLHKSLGNCFEQVSFIRSFFDRFTTLYARRVLGRKKQRWLYRERDIRTFYSDIQGADEEIRVAEGLRRENPLVHAGSELIRDSHGRDIEDVSESLVRLIFDLLQRTDKDKCEGFRSEV